MINLFSIFVKKRHALIVDESDVMTTLKVLDEISHKSRFHIITGMEIGNCGWSNDPTAWFIHYDATAKQWRSVIEKFEQMNYQIVLKQDERFHLNKKG